MKKSNLAVIIVLITLVAVSWVSLIANGISQGVTYSGYLSAAKEYQENGLFQKAIASWESALSIKESKQTRLQWLQTYALAYADGVVTTSKYADALSLMCELNEGDPVYWEQLMELYLSEDNMNRLNDVCQLANKAEVTSDRIKEIMDIVNYAVRSTRASYKEVCRGTNGQFTALTSTGWGLLDKNGEILKEFNNAYIGPMNREGIAMYVSEKDSRLIDQQGVVQAIVTVPFAKTGAYGEGILPLCQEDGAWKFYDCDAGAFLSGSYEEASNFTGGIAAVKQPGGWILIDKTGNQICETVFSDIKLHGCGEYANGGVMIASVGGKYGMYDAKGQKLNEFTCADMDLYMGGPIAYQAESGKWGFVDTEGNVIMEAQLENAKSFSAGLAAICKDGLWGFIRNDGKLVIEYQYLDGGYFNSSGVCFVSIYEDQIHKIEFRF